MPACKQLSRSSVVALADRQPKIDFVSEMEGENDSKDRFEIRSSSGTHR